MLNNSHLSGLSVTIILVYLKIHFYTFSLQMFFLLLSPHCSPVESSRFGSSGNLSQISSQLSETGPESTGGSELEESFHSYHSTGLQPTALGKPPTHGHVFSNGHSNITEQKMHRLSPEDTTLKKVLPPEKGSPKFQR